MKRPAGHIAGEEAVATVKAALPSEWIVRTEHPDYGIDLAVEIVSGGAVSGKSLRIQVKAVQTLRTIGRYALYRPRPQHLQYWQRSGVPVILALVERRTGFIYWQWIQGCRGLKPLRSCAAGVLQIPLRNQLALAAGHLAAIAGVSGLYGVPDLPAAALTTYHELHVRRDLARQALGPRFRISVSQHTRTHAEHAATLLADLGLWKEASAVLWDLEAILEVIDDPSGGWTLDTILRNLYHCWIEGGEAARVLSMNSSSVTGEVFDRFIRARAALSLGDFQSARAGFSDVLQDAPNVRTREQDEAQELRCYTLVNLALALEGLGQEPAALQFIRTATSEYGSDWRKTLIECRLLLKTSALDELADLLARKQLSLAFHFEYWLILAITAARLPHLQLGELQLIARQALLRADTPASMAGLFDLMPVADQGWLRSAIRAAARALRVRWPLSVSTRSV